MTLDQGSVRIQVTQAGLLPDDHETRLGLTSTLLARKGLVRLLALQGLDEQVAEGIRTAYYSSPRFDIGRSLAAVFTEAYDANTELAEGLPGAVVVLGLDVYLVGTPALQAWIVGFGGVQCAFDVRRRVGLPAQLAGRPSYAVDWDIHVAHWRLTAGQMLVAVIGDESYRLDDRRMGRLATRHGNPQHLAEAVMRTLDRPGRAGALVCAATGFAPVPSLGDDMPQPQHVRPIGDEWPRRRGVSPIWIAVVLATLAVFMALRMGGTTNSLEALREYARTVFNPEPTATPEPAFTPTPVQEIKALLPAPELVAPEDDASLTDPTVVLSWNWSQRLSSGQLFEVRVARAGQTLTAFTETDLHEAEYAPERTGWYEWAVVVMRDGDSLSPKQDSDLSATGTFFWQGE